MSKRHFVAVHTDSDCIIGCEHKHPTVTHATACISQPAGYVVAVRRRKFFPLTEAEEAEFQKAMYGERDEGTRRPDFNVQVSLFVVYRS